MSDIKDLIELLKSDNPNKRYDACEELRVSQQPLPQEAIDALKIATNDSNPDVADAAQRALAVHAPQPKLEHPEAIECIKKIESPEPETTEKQEETITNVSTTTEGALPVIVASAIFTNYISIFLILSEGNLKYFRLRYILDEMLVARCILGSVPALVFGIIGYYAWRSSWRKGGVKWELKNNLFELIIIGFLAGLFPGICASLLAG